MILDTDNDDILIERLYDIYTKYNELKARHEAYKSYPKGPIPYTSTLAFGGQLSSGREFAQKQEALIADHRAMQKAAIDQLRNQVATSAICQNL